MLKLQLVVCSGLVALSFHAIADSNNKVDCAGLRDWNSDATYSKGDTVKAKSGVSQYDAKFKCSKDKCHGVGENQPYYDNGKTWEKVGVCK